MKLKANTFKEKKFTLPMWPTVTNKMRGDGGQCAHVLDSLEE